MNLPLLHNLHLHPYARGGRLHPEAFTRTDNRQALGSVPHVAGQPNHGCESCWPAQVHAPYWDASGHACCPMCMGNPNRVARMPHGLFRSVH